MMKKGQERGEKIHFSGKQQQRMLVTAPAVL
jgi:hypothetical protein